VLVLLLVLGLPEQFGCVQRLAVF
jgi:hypothetical protein